MSIFDFPRQDNAIVIVDNLPTTSELKDDEKKTQLVSSSFRPPPPQVKTITTTRSELSSDLSQPIYTSTPSQSSKEVSEPLHVPTSSAYRYEHHYVATTHLHSLSLLHVGLMPFLRECTCMTGRKNYILLNSTPYGAGKALVLGPCCSAIKGEVYDYVFCRGIHLIHRPPLRILLRRSTSLHILMVKYLLRLPQLLPHLRRQRPNSDQRPVPLLPIPFHHSMDERPRPGHRSLTRPRPGLPGILPFQVVLLSILVGR